MALKSKIQKIKKKPSRMAVSITERQFWGREHEWTNEVLSEIQTIISLNWYNAMVDSDQSRDWALEFLKEIDTELYERVSSQTCKWTLPSTTGHLSRLILKGYTIPDCYFNWLMESFNSALESEKRFLERENKNRPFVYRSNADRERDKFTEFMAEFEGLLDDLIELNETDFSFRDFFILKEAPSYYINLVLKKVQLRFQEVFGALEGDDEDLKEAYRNYTTEELECLILFFNSIIEDCEDYLKPQKVFKTSPPSVSSPPVKPKRSRSIDPSKAVQHFVYCKEDPTFGKSVDPREILGSAEVWFYNFRYRILTVYRSGTSKGLGIHRSSIIGFDPKTSTSYKIGRKDPVSITKKIRENSKAVAAVEVKEFTETGLAPRCNENTVVIRVYR